MRIARLILAASAALLSISALAQTTPYQEYDRLVKANEMISPLSSDLFGDDVGLYNGSTGFTVSDIDIPGNNSLPVRLGRTFKVELRNDADSLGGFGAWDIEVPYITGVFPAGGKWDKSGLQPLPRCSAPFFPDVPAPFSLSDIWTGTQVHVPGRGSQTMMWNGVVGNPQPTDGQSYYWNTRDQMRFRCTSMLNYGGEGFIGVDSAGVKYFFNYAIERAGGVIRKSAAGWGEVAANRFKIYLVATRVEDRFGNYVDYTYQGDRLVKISSSDQRVIDLTYTDGRITKATAHGREWQYAYSASQYFSIHPRAKALTSVTLPDLSRWQYQYQGTLQLDPIIQDSATGDMRCIEPLPNHGGFGLVATHPSGAVGNFAFAYQRHGISGTPATACVLEAVIGGVQHWSLAIPDYFYNFALATKQISGPGLQTMQWQYTYGDPLTGRANYGGFHCTTCDEEKSVWVTNPDGTKDEYVFGVLFNFNDGQLLGKYRRQADNKIARAELTEYVTTAEAGAMPFPKEIGVLHGAFDYTTGYNRPVKKTTILQDGYIAGPVEYVPPPSTPNPPNPGDPGPPACEPQPPTYTCVDPMALPGGPVALMSTTTSSSSPGVPAVAFVRQVNTFDVHARPVSVTLSNTMAGSVAKTEVTTYHDNTNRWVMGQVANRVINGFLASETGYDTMARPVTHKAFGKLMQTLTYNADGTVATVKDGNNNVITLSNWKRGIPQTIKHPATPEATAGATESAFVIDSGWIASVTDENGFTTNYTHDAMGRLASIVYPTGDTVGWTTTTLSFAPSPTPVYGLPAGHWRQVIQTGNSRKVVMMDALWRPVVTETYDAADLNGTISQLINRYDQDGRTYFTSYPQRNLDPSVYNTWANPALTPNALGVHSFYDALGRITSSSQDSELGLLTTLTSYGIDNLGLYTLVTNPRGVQTLTRHQMFDQPVYDAPVLIDMARDRPERSVVDITRDIFGKPKRIRKGNASGSLSVDRHYVYRPDFQTLCKTIEPETGVTVMDYDGAGNLGWNAGGLNGGSFASLTDCSLTDAWNSGRRVNRSYDARNRLKTLTFPGGSGNQAWEYWADGLPYKITTHNDGLNAGIVENTYAYNKRRMLTGESSTQLGWYTWGLGYAYDANGNLSTQTYPTGLAISYAPNALGQATQARDQSGYYYASGASYYPNGALKQFTYGNGILHSMSQNARLLPKDVVSSGGVLHERYAYDANGNVESITDVQAGGHLAWAVRNRYMGYDGLDRLTSAGSGSFGGDHWHRFTYDALDNITSWKLAGVKDYASYVYDGRNQLGLIRNSSGATVVGFGYDPQGNVNNKNGQEYKFDYGNRLRVVTGKEHYRYDGHGRRVLAWDPVSTNNILSMYSQSGKLMYEEDYRVGEGREHIYFAGSNVASRAWSYASSSSSAKFYHTDALGSPIAVTNQAGTVIERNDYEPYGAVIGKPNYQGIGYTGHVQDAATKLTYMQQRYYDSQVGLFLSVDPVTAHSDPVGMFNRYKYAANNPYRFVDPDGRQERAAEQFGEAYARNPESFAPFEPIAIQITATAVAMTPVVGPYLGLSLRRLDESVSRTGPKGVEPGRHNANVTVRDKDGNIVSHHREVSGNMTDAEKKLGFPQNTLASHTEARAVQTPMKPGESMTITGQRAPCPSCKGKMNEAAETKGVKIQYQWRENGKTERWKTK
ncbi:RHS repeat-associated core domain-containing protein [Pseudoxanthomonas sp. PXM01]|uniref:RHS repeat-associated core domain-containing protein n=1 Tax=Pseudoxanthomonas sp. PXM01 TaxID=2769295 RepID=UPI00177E97C9|nr:RHS repeat-associated core domain-containing protein [Pseudoxanthomonas sp. PXM01]MBD9468385.1 RHS repeat protein [Pseudoxanthomonas sp. PXM01]